MGRKRTGILWTLDIEVLRTIVQQSNSLAGVLRHFALPSHGCNYHKLKARLKEEGIDYSHIVMGNDSNKGRKFDIPQRSIEEVMVRHSKCGRTSLRRRLIRDKIIPYECQICNLSPIWNHKKLSLVLDHINGINNDHRKENLRFLCPNCNSQTNTFAGRNARKKQYCLQCGKPIHRKSKRCPDCRAFDRRKVSWPEKEELQKMLWETPTSQIARRYGVSDKAIEKWVKKYGLSKPPRGHWGFRCHLVG